MWKCVNCAEQVEDQFEICWSCGFGKDGSPPPAPQTIKQVEETKIPLDPLWSIQSTFGFKPPEQNEEAQTPLETVKAASHAPAIAPEQQIAETPSLHDKVDRQISITYEPEIVVATIRRAFVRDFGLFGFLWLAGGLTAAVYLLISGDYKEMNQTRFVL